MITRLQEKKQNQCAAKVESQDTTACTGKVAKQREPLFIKAEKNEQDFINTRKQCLEAGDCDNNPPYEKARYDVLYTTLQLVSYIETLKNKSADECTACEKTEAKDLKKRLTELLNSTK